MDSKIVNKIIRNKVLYAEIKAKQQELTRLQNQINEIEQAQKDIVFEIQKRYDEAQKNAEWLADIEYQALIKEAK